MSAWETFAFGMLGGAIAYVGVFLLPELRKWFDGGLAPSWPRLIPALAILLVYILMAGVIAIFIGDAEKPKHAIAYGIGWEAFVKALATTAAASAPKVG